MRTISKAVVGTRPALLLGAVAVILALATGALAKKPDKPAQPASVIAHVPLEGAVASQMYLQVQGDKRYLYIDQGTNQGYTVVDITKATQPNIIKRATSGKLQVVGSDLALAEAPEQSKTVARSHSPTESVTRARHQRPGESEDHPDLPGRHQRAAGQRARLDLPDQQRRAVDIAADGGHHAAGAEKAALQLGIGHLRHAPGLRVSPLPASGLELFNRRQPAGAPSLWCASPRAALPTSPPRGGAVRR